MFVQLRQLVSSTLAVLIGLSAGCAELPLPEAGDHVVVTRLAAHGSELPVALSAERSGAVWRCLRQAHEVPPVDVGAAQALAEGTYVIRLFSVDGAADGGMGADGGETASVGRTSSPAPMVLRLETARRLRLSDGRQFRSRCLYDLVRDRRVEPEISAW
ncbi:MAG: hypothetical protein KC502_20995 [Myxococcales bacterium]|nr:hypothetical protein [Myxococcales bacterium]